MDMWKMRGRRAVMERSLRSNPGVFRHVIDQALALTTLRESNSLPCSRPVSLPEIINAGMDSLAPSIREAGIEIKCRTAPDVPMIMADPDLVVRCLTNLIENSIKYARGGGWVQVSARAGRYAGRWSLNWPLKIVALAFRMWK